MANELQQKETPIDQEIVNELIELTPEWWNSASLDVKYIIDQGVERYSHVISSPEGHKDIIEPSEELFDATYRLGQLFKAYGKHWKNAKYYAWLQEDGNWKYKVDFEY